jgi:hypothetical protein
MTELLLPCGFDTLEYSWVKATIGICTLVDYSVAKKCQQEARHSFTRPPHTHGELVWRQPSRPRLHRWLTLRSPSGTLGTGVATQVTTRVVVTTPLIVTLSLASEPEPPPLPGALTGTLLWSDTSVLGLTRLSTRWKGSDDLSDEWMTLHTCKQRCKPPSTHRLA